jgi:RimJ/RimL family protein N-acetyltransferase
MSYHIDYYAITPGKSASVQNMEGYREVERIMDTIYQEDPRKWPYGLNIPAHDGGVYLVRKSASMQPVGFVGWQERQNGPHRVGYYSVGILPDYRGEGLAKQAVARLLAEKAAGVDEVRALIIKSNTASRALAQSLDIPVELV